MCRVRLSYNHASRNFLGRPHQMKQLLIATYWLVAALSTEAGELTGRVVSVSDGNTLRVLVDDQQIKIRLGGIDASESDQPFAVFVTFC